MTLLEAAQTTLRRLHDSRRTEEAYLYWIREFIRFHHKQHPRTMGAREITAFLNDLATQRRVSREVLALLDKLEPPFRPMGEIFYGAGLRLMECVSLRVKDVDLGLGETSRLHQGVARYVGSSGISGEPGQVIPTF